jgi:hypothetical protein
MQKDLSGAVQKGPYLNGTTLRISELTDEMVQTGRTFNAQTNSNLGTFQTGTIELESQYVELQADGFYFNEVIGESSPSRLILYALSDLGDRNTLNVNLISHLEKDRVKSLVSGGLSFATAKRQVQEEILGIFSLSMDDYRESELLDISGPGDDNARLLAISVIIQAYRSVAEVSELVADINADFLPDGVLDDEVLGSSLVSQAVVLNLPAIRENLEDRYAATGLEVEIGNFERYVQEFIENTPFPISEGISYPPFSEYGENILHGEETDTLEAGKIYSMAAGLPPGAEVEVVISRGIWGIVVAPDGPVNWDVGEYDWDNKIQTFRSIEKGVNCDLKILFDPDTLSGNSTPDPVLIEVFENRSTLPTLTRELYIQGSSWEEEVEPKNLNQ